jgi:hypothetical protein
VSSRRWLALSSLIASASISGCGRDDRFARARVTVSIAATQAGIGSIQLSIDSAPGDASGAPGFPIAASMSPAEGGDLWTADVAQIPASMSAVSRTFTASAWSGANGTGAKLYEGSTVAPVAAGGSAQVAILLQEQNVPPGAADFPPVITSATSTAASVLPGQTGTFSATAYDPDDPAHFNRPQFDGDPLAYSWSASCDSGSLLIDSPAAATTTFTAPSVPAALCAVTLLVSETALASNASTSTAFTVTVHQ